MKLQVKGGPAAANSEAAQIGKHGTVHHRKKAKHVKNPPPATRGMLRK